MLNFPVEWSMFSHKESSPVEVPVLIGNVEVNDTAYMIYIEQEVAGLSWRWIIPGVKGARGTGETIEKAKDQSIEALGVVLASVS